MAAPQAIIWKKRILVPFWIVRICLMLFIIAAYGLYISVVRKDDGLVSPAVGVIVVFMLLIIAVLLMDVMAIILFLRDGLHPKTFLILNCAQTAFWAGVLLMDLVYVARGSSAVGIGFSVFVFLTFLALLIYASVGYHRQRKQGQRGNYALAQNPAMPAYQGGPQYPQNTAYQSPVPYPTQPSNPYLPPYQSHGSSADYYSHQPEVKPTQTV